MKGSIEWQLIAQFYKEAKASRSQVPLINHITEGLDILEELGAGDLAKRAYCLHPLLQNDKDLPNTWQAVASICPADSVLLAMEYRRAANAYLCRPDTDHFALEDLVRVVGDQLLPEVRAMLIADKRQNQKDFQLYHRGTHARSAQLESYFATWLTYLDRPHVSDYDRAALAGDVQ